MRPRESCYRGLDNEDELAGRSIEPARMGVVRMQWTIKINQFESGNPEACCANTNRGGRGRGEVLMEGGQRQCRNLFVWIDALPSVRGTEEGKRRQNNTTAATRTLQAWREIAEDPSGSLKAGKEVRL